MVKLVDGICSTAMTPLFTRAKMGKGYELDIILLASMFKKITAIDDINVRQRSVKIDNFVEAFLKKKPDAIIGNFGCGFCTRFWRIDNGEVKWVNFDLQGIIDLRDEFFPKEDRVKDFKCNFKVEKLSIVFDLIIAEGLFPYLPKDSSLKHISSEAIFDLSEKGTGKNFVWPYTGEDIKGLKIHSKEKFGASGRPVWLLHAEPERHDVSL